MSRKRKKRRGFRRKRKSFNKVKRFMSMALKRGKRKRGYRIARGGIML